MKLGCCMGISPRDADLSVYLQKLHRLGYDYVEFPAAGIAAMEAAAFEALCDTMLESPVPCEACNSLFPADIRLTGGYVDDDAVKAYLDAAFDRTARLGVKVLVFGSAGAKNIPEGFPYEAAAKQYLKIIRVLEGYAAEYNMVVVLEHLNRGEANFVTSIREACGFVRQAALPHIGLLIDYYHMKVENEDEAIIDEVCADLRHVHIADAQGRSFPFEENQAQYAAFFNRLRSNGYKGRVSIEASSENMLADAARSAAVLKSII